MVIIWGFKVREKTLGTGIFHCPTCRTARDYQRIRLARYFTLYFVPLFRTATLGEFVVCSGCALVFTPDVLDDAPPTDAVRRFCGQCGSPADVAGHFCRSCGAALTGAA